ncbi:MAG TPA: hypothetical protein EYG81_03080 [Archaeoglobus profundus]|nr:hypothetical protein [Archaeoglobus profundus]HIP57957.1 hypothetical protein [Archaeoglobus profundus]
MDKYRTDLIKTLVPIGFGVIAGIISFFITGNLRSRDPLGIIILVLMIYLHKFILPKLGVKLEAKDWLSISFMTFTTWYIAWTILLNLY